jgi:N-glycosylase/DNA lyase
MSTYQLKKIEKEILSIHATIAEAIDDRLSEFRYIWEKGSDRDLFRELVFCLLTPQSNARMCWRAVENIIRKRLLFNGCFDDICRELNIVRFKNNKTRYILEARDAFIAPKGSSIRGVLGRCGNVADMRDYLYRCVKGMGYKEASHFLRNIGFGDNIAILDRHVLRNMRNLGLIDELPPSLTPSRYCEMENLLKAFSRKIDIPLDHLDFVLWYKETGDIFK